MRTLVVIFGNARGGEQTWRTLYENLLEPYQADLALCFGQSNDHSSSLYKKARYIWEIEEYKDWGEVFTRETGNDNWKHLARCNMSSGLMGGAGLDGRLLVGSGAIVFTFRWFVKTHRQVLEQYNRIILTRSDHYYLGKHPILDNDYVWVVSGQDWGGICDRHHIFPTSEIDRMLGIVEYIGNLSAPYPQGINPEGLLKRMMIDNGVWQLVRRFKRIMFTVALPSDSTRWSRGGRKFADTGLLHKYYGEYTETRQNLKSLKLRIALVMVIENSSPGIHYFQSTVLSLQMNGFFENPYFTFTLVSTGDRVPVFLENFESFHRIQITRPISYPNYQEAVAHGINIACRSDCNIVLLMANDTQVCRNFPQRVVEFISRTENENTVCDFATYHEDIMDALLSGHSDLNVDTIRCNKSRCLALPGDVALGYAEHICEAVKNTNRIAEYIGKAVRSLNRFVQNLGRTVKATNRYPEHRVGQWLAESYDVKTVRCAVPPLVKSVRYVDDACPGNDFISCFADDWEDMPSDDFLPRRCDVSSNKLSLQPVEGGEKIQVKRDGKRYAKLSLSACMVYDLCDGKKRQTDIIRTLSDKFPGQEDDIRRQVPITLKQLQSAGLICHASAGIRDSASG